MKRVIINVDDPISELLAVRKVESVISSGRISKNGESYCAVTVFGDKVVVYADVTRTGNDTFRVAQFNREGEAK